MRDDQGVGRPPALPRVRGDGGGITTVGTDGCEQCGRQTASVFKRRYYRALAEAEAVEVVTRRRRR